MATKTHVNNGVEQNRIPVIFYKQNRNYRESISREFFCLIIRPFPSRITSSEIVPWMTEGSRAFGLLSIRLIGTWWEARWEAEGWSRHSAVLRKSPILSSSFTLVLF